MAKKTVLSLGQCAADQWHITRLLSEEFDAEVIAADRFAEAESRLREGGIDLVLVNRVLDRDGSSGLDFIRRVKGNDALRQVPVMLVSNHADAQNQAMALGAMPGFGKASLDEEETQKRLEGVIGAPLAG